MSDGRIEGFKARRLPGDGIEIDALVGGSGPPLLLLHGWPQTRLCWAKVAPALAENFTVVVPDLRGYGRSDKPQGGGDHLAYAKRTMARDQIATMKALGFNRFALAGHDRGGRVGYRLALDHPEVVTRLAVLDIVPTADVWAGMNAAKANKMWHWPFLAQHDGLAEMLIGGNPDHFIRYILAHQSGRQFSFDPASVADYVACNGTRGGIHAMAEDYRAGWGVDRDLDEADRGTRRITAALLVLWGEQGSLAGQDPLPVWRSWADQVEGEALPGGHFVPEEAPAETTARLRRFFTERNESDR